MIGESSKGHFGTRIVFLNEEMRSAFRQYWSRDKFREAFMKFHGSNSNQSNSTLTRWSDMLYDSLMKNDHVVVGVPARPQGHKPVVEIWGHGYPTGTEIGDGAGNRIQAQELVRTLKEQGLITPDTRVKLSTCHGATSCSVNTNLPLSASQIERAFLGGELHGWMTDGDNSLLKSIRHEVTAQIPNHNSTVEGFLGSVNRVPGKGVLHRDGTKGFSYFVILYSDDGKLVKLNRSDMKVVLRRDS